MKLTKGRIMKMLNKKRQSLKRYKKGKRSHKIKTFRKRKHFNLHNRSLKKYRGGQPEVASNDKPVDASNPTHEIIADPEPITKEDQVEREGEGEREGMKEVVAPDNELSSQSPNEVHFDVPEAKIAPEAEVAHEVEVAHEDEVASEGTGAPEETDLHNDLEGAPEESVTRNEHDIVAPEEEGAATPIVEQDLTTNNESSGAGEGPGADAQLPLSIDEKEQEQEQKQEQIEPQIEHSEDNGEAAGVDAVATSSTSSLANETGDTGLTIVAESLENLANYISEKIAQKVSDKMREGSTYGKSNEDLDSFNKAAIVSQEMAYNNE